MRSTFIETLLRCAKEDKDIILLTADLGFKLFDDYRAILPDQFINVGVAEQNMLNVATGLALSKKRPYCYSMVPFLTMRAFEQIRIGACNHKLPITLVGVGGGLSYGMEGMTHHGFEDVSIMRSLPGMTVTAPADPVECAAIINESVSYKGPLFVRLGKNDDPIIHKTGTNVKIGKGIVVNEGRDVCILATGSMLSLGVELIKEIVKHGLNPTVVSIHTVKPLDEDLVLKLAAKHGAIFTIEEHSIIGGLGSAVAECLAEAGFSGKFKRLGLPDRYCKEIGGHAHLLGSVGLTAAKLAEAIIKALKF